MTPRTPALDSRLKNPGPGHYDFTANNSIGKTGSAATMPPRRPIVEPGSASPGPIYNTRPEAGSSSPRYSMGGRREFTGADKPSPGPGDYEPPAAIGTKPGKSFGGRHDIKTTKDHTPGPGQRLATCDDDSLSSLF